MMLWIIITAVAFCGLAHTRGDMLPGWLAKLKQHKGQGIAVNINSKSVNTILGDAVIDNSMSVPKIKATITIGGETRTVEIEEGTSSSVLITNDQRPHPDSSFWKAAGYRSPPSTIVAMNIWNTDVTNQVSAGLRGFMA